MGYAPLGSSMKINAIPVNGNWKLGFALDKHSLKSTFTGYNDYGHPTFETVRTEVGEALYQLKYRNDFSQIPGLVQAVVDLALKNFPEIGLVVPMPPSKVRQRQPVIELAEAVAAGLGVPAFPNMLSKTPAPPGAPELKNLGPKEEKVAALAARMKLSKAIANEGKWNALIVDDLFDSGASLEAACDALRTYEKIADIYVVALTRK